PQEQKTSFDSGERTNLRPRNDGQCQVLQAGASGIPCERPAKGHVARYQRGRLPKRKKPSGSRRASSKSAATSSPSSTILRPEVGGSRERASASPTPRGPLRLVPLTRNPLSGRFFAESSHAIERLIGAVGCAK